MRRVRRFAVVLLVVGALVVVSSSGAFESMTAERGVSVGVAEDSEAIVGLEYPDANESRVVNLDVDEADSRDCGPSFFPVYCTNRYDGAKLIRFTDNTQSGQLGFDQFSIDARGDNITVDTRSEAESTGMRTVAGDFECDSLFGTQEDSSANVTVSFEISDGTVTVDGERRVEIRCA